jgi:D-alanine-D-alanine ligase
MRIAVTYSRQHSSDEAEAELDRAEDIEAIATAIDGIPIDVRCPLPELVARLAEVAPELILNLAEGERGPFREAFYPALFDQLGYRYVGSSPSVLALCLDKQLCNRVVAAAGVRVPGSGPPFMVKPRYEGSSKGITQASVVATRAQLARAIAACPYPAIVEEYVDGIDVAVAFVEGIGLLPPIAYAYTPTGPHRIYDLELKQARERVRPYVIAAPAVTAAAGRVFAALGVTGFGRADFRLTPDGEAVFLDMNPLPTLVEDDFYVASGLTRAELLRALVTPPRRTGPARSSARRAAASRSGPPRTRPAARSAPLARAGRSHARRRSRRRARSAAPS